MDMSSGKKSSKSTVTKDKLDEIITFCQKSGKNANKMILTSIRGKIDDLSDKFALLIDVVWMSLKGIDSSKEEKYVIIDVMKILSQVLGLLGFAFPMFSLGSYIVSLVAIFLKVIFQKISLNKMLTPKISPNDDVRHELAGLAEKMKRTANFIDEVDEQQHVNKATLQVLISNDSIHIGVELLGNLKSRIETLMSGGEKDWCTCLEFLKMFVRISTLRHTLLFRIMTCLEAKNYSLCIVSALQKYIDIEKKENQTFLAFFSSPSLNNVGVLAFLNPSDGEELLTYLEQLHLSIQNLHTVLHDQIFLITPKINQNDLFGRPTGFAAVRAMRSSTNVQNARIRFRFKAIQNEFNLFYIQSEYSDEYVFMKESGYCKYDKSVHKQDNAKWRVILVQDTKEEEGTHSCFTLCTKKWPEKFVFMENTFFKNVRGLGINGKPSVECLFTLTPPGGSPIVVQVAKPGSLTMTAYDVDEKASVKTSFDDMGNQTISFIETIRNFLKERKIEVERDIRRIEKYIWENKEDPLNAILERVAKALVKLEGHEVTDEVLIGLVEMLSISFELFQNGKFLYASILRQVLRICGLVMSCFWQISYIVSYITCSCLAGDQKVAIDKNILKLQNFASYLHEIECAANIFERDIDGMKRSGAFCEELCQTQLREWAEKNPKLIVTYVKLSILQQTILWQMYAVAKQPGHSDIIANHLHSIILLQKERDVSYFKKYINGTEPVLVSRYLTCLGCQLQMPVSRNDDKLTRMQKNRRMSLVFNPLLQAMLFKHADYRNEKEREWKGKTGT